MKKKRSNDGDFNEPFEWLTNFSSLEALLDPAWLYGRGKRTETEQCDVDHKNLKVLHVGCGSSTLGSNLMLKYPQYTYIANVDNDMEILRQMKERWHRIMKRYADRRKVGKVLYTHMDFKEKGGLSIEDPELDTIEEGTKFDLVLDKSTLDCLLCSDDGASGLIYNIYRNLKPGGVYFLVSFHDVEFIYPLLKNCPGLVWDVERYVAKRKVESPEIARQEELSLFSITSAYTGTSCENDTNESLSLDQTDGSPPPMPSPSSSSSAKWSSGTFEPGEEYGKTVNVFICRRTEGTAANGLNLEDVTSHLHRCNDEYFQHSNPMVTHIRKEEIERTFLKHLGIGSAEISLSSAFLPLETCYEILFTEAEKEVLGYDNFLDDISAFSSSTHLTVNEGMTYDMAISFLEEMQ